MAVENKCLFETCVCGRCCGSGRYSFNMMDGDRCYGCGGLGWKLTARGAAANKMFKAARSFPASAFKVGDLIKLPGYKFGTVKEIVFGPAKELGTYQVGFEDNIEAKIVTGGCVYRCELDTLFLKGMSAEEKAPLIADALAYQATLGKNGKPLKTLKKAA